MIKEIELKLIDDKGNYSIAHIDYKGYMNMLFHHDIDLVKDALEGMIFDYKVNNRMEIDIKKYPCVNHDADSWDEEEANKRMDVIGQNGNEGTHYVTNEEADEDAIGKHIQFRSPHKH
jgi:hypothetical protein